VDNYGSQRWTPLKLEIVRKYLAAYTTALKNQSFRTHYIDAFAGTGYVDLRRGAEPEPGLFADLDEAQSAAENLLQGSAQQALEIDPPFDHFTFIEQNPNRAEQLRELQKKYHHLWPSVDVLTEDANVALQRICAKWDRRNDRAVVFLDPFAMSVDWSTLEAIAQTQSMDVWYLFPWMAVNRMLPYERTPLPEWEGKLNRFFGTTDWRSALYAHKSEPTLFDVQVSETRVADIDQLRAFALERFHTIFADVAKNPRELRTENGSPLFLLCFAASNPRGARVAIKIAQDILRVT